MPYKDPEVMREYQRTYKNRRYKEDATFREHIKAWRKDRQRGYWLQHKYGITVDDYEALAIKQQYKCYLCKNERNKLHVDHDHNNGMVRGLLCMNCNTALGRLENIGIDEVISYLKGENNGKN